MLASCVALPVEDASLAEARGCVLAVDVVAVDDIPPFDNSAMDGFAVRSDDVAGASADTPAVLEVVDTVLAGHTTTCEVGVGQAVRIMTGAPMPVGADAVVIVERTRTVEGGVAVLAAVGPGDNVRRAGDDLRAGVAALSAGTVLRPAALGVAAGAGHPTVAVHRRPRVGVISTGDELVAPGVPLGPGQIRDTNRAVLLGLLAADGFEPIDLGRVRDDADEISSAISAAVERCDALLTTGGVSMGDVDLVKVVLDRLGEMRWMQLAIKPAKPFAFGVLSSGDRRSPVFGLPGNPVSSVVSYQLLARPGLRRLAGFADDQLVRRSVPAVAASALRRRPDGKVHYARVALRRDSSGTLLASSAGGQHSHQLSALAAADGLAVLCDGDGVEAGDPVDVLVLHDVDS